MQNSDPIVLNILLRSNVNETIFFPSLILDPWRQGMLSIVTLPFTWMAIMAIALKCLSLEGAMHWMKMEGN